MAFNDLVQKLRGLMGVWNDSTSPSSPEFDAQLELRRFGEKSISINLDPSTVLATATTLRHVFTPLRDITVLGVSYLPDGALTAAGTSYATITCKLGAGTEAASATIANVTTVTTNMVAGTPYALTLTAANVDVDAGETISAQIAKAGAGIAVPKGSLIIHYRER